MAIKRTTQKLRGGAVIDVAEYHDGRYGAPGMKRVKRQKPTIEQMQEVNRLNKVRKCRYKLLEYFNPGDTFATWTYNPDDRPPDMAAALKDFQNAMKYVRRQYKKRNKTLYWIRNIERGTKGAWHIHLIINEIGDTASIIKDAWNHGGTYITTISNNDKIYDEDFSKLASYITKDVKHTEKKADGTDSKPRLKEASYSTSRNMPIKPAIVDRLKRWKQEVKPKKGYYIAKIHEGINPITGYLYRRYTMIRLKPEKEDRHIRRARGGGT